MDNTITEALLSNFPSSNLALTRHCEAYNAEAISPVAAAGPGRHKADASTELGEVTAVGRYDHIRSGGRPWPL